MSRRQATRTTTAPDPVRAQQLVEGIRALDRQRARLDAQLHHLVFELDQVYGHTRDVATELGLALAIGEHPAARLIDQSVALLTRLPETFAALGRGEFSAFHASKVVEATAWLSDEHAHRVDAGLAGTLEEKDPGQVRRRTRELAYKTDPDGAATRTRHARTNRKVTLHHGDDGLSTLAADLPAEVASAAYARIDNMARSLRCEAEPRTLDQLRADVLTDLLLGKTEPHGRVKADIYVYVDAQTLAGLDGEPAQLAGHGPIPNWLARQIAFDPHSTWKRIVTDPLTGAPIDVGRHRYRPPAVTDEFVRVRDRECRFPGCHRPAQFGDNDHHHDYGKGGDTDEKNLHNLCRRHHDTKDPPGWDYKIDDTGTLTITTPAGQTYTSPPEPLHEPDQDPDPEPDPAPEPDPPPF